MTPVWWKPHCICQGKPLLKLTDGWNCLNKHNWPSQSRQDLINTFLLLFLRKTLLMSECKKWQSLIPAKRIKSCQTVRLGLWSTTCEWKAYIENSYFTSTSAWDTFGQRDEISTWFLWMGMHTFSSHNITLLGHRDVNKLQVISKHWIISLFWGKRL